MRITRVLAGSAAVIAAAAGVGLAVAGPASAGQPSGDPSGTWRAFGNTVPTTASLSTWSCAPSHQIGVSVVAQVCVVISPDKLSIQPAVIVRNDKPVEYDATAFMQLVQDSPPGPVFGYNCPQSGVASHSWSVCFGNTVGNFGGAFARGTAGNDVSLGMT